MKIFFTKKQTTWVLVMVAVAAVLAALILRPNKSSAQHDAKPEQRAENKEPASKQELGAQNEKEELEKKSATTESDEGGKPIALSDAQMKAAGIQLSTAREADVETVITLPGEVRVNEDKTARVMPRLTGVVESIHANIGQSVKKGQVLAVIASGAVSDQRSDLLTAQKRLAFAKSSLARERKLWEAKISAEQDYLQAQRDFNEAEIAARNAQQKLHAVGAADAGGGELSALQIRAPFDGVVTSKHISLGETVKEDSELFVVTDLGTVWADFAVSPKDLSLVKLGQKVAVRAAAFDANTSGSIIYVGSLLGDQSRAAVARVALANPGKAWRPGLFVSVDVVSGTTKAEVAIPADAVQSVNDKPTVFVQTPKGLKAQQVKLGRTGGKLVEVVKGLEPGIKYVSTGSYILKSELAKASADAD